VSTKRICTRCILSFCIYGAAPEKTRAGTVRSGTDGLVLFSLQMEGKHMLKTSLAISALAASMAVLSSPAMARDYPFCLREGGEAGPGTCYYQNYAQCQASASGRVAYCYPNPRMAYGYYGRSAPVQSGYYGRPAPYRSGYYARPAPYQYQPAPSYQYGYQYGSPANGIPGNLYAGGGPYGANQATNGPHASNEIAGGR
jgi:hypothetical protein